MTEQISTEKAQSDQPCFQNGNLVSAMYHDSKELGIRMIHNPTRMEAVEFDLQTVEIQTFRIEENLRTLTKFVGELIEANKLLNSQVVSLKTKLEGIN